MRQPIKTSIIICIFVAPSLYILFMVMLRMPDRRYPTDYPAVCKPIEKAWLTNNFVNVYNLSVCKISNLLKFSTCVGEHSDVQSYALFRDTAKLLEAFMSASFEDYTNRIGDEGVFALRAKTKEYVLRESGHNPLRPCSDIEAAKLYWTQLTDNGKWAGKSPAVASNRTKVNYITLTNDVEWIKQLHDFPSIMNEPLSGFQAYSCVIKYSPSHTEIYRQCGKLIVADISILMRVASRYDNKPRAYPMVLRMYWQEDKERWLPLGYGYALVNVREWQPVL